MKATYYVTYYKNGERRFRQLPEDTIPQCTPPENDVVTKLEADIYADSDSDSGEGLQEQVDDGLESAALFKCGRMLSSLRKASIYGYTQGSDMTTGPSVPPQETPQMHTMGYDIETESMMDLKSLTMPHDRITCASIWCTCGYSVSYNSMDKSIIESEYFTTSAAICDQMHKDIMEHSPDWLVGYNSFRFDNLCMAYHSKLARYEKVAVKSTGKASPALMMYQRGINNIDAYVYMDVVYRSKFASLSLGAVAKDLGLDGKGSMPTKSELSTKEGRMAHVRYNLKDSQLTAQVFEKLDIARQLIALCSVMKSAMVDVCRYTTGTMMACMISSYALSEGQTMSWSRCSHIMDRFEGGLVLDPVLGHWKNVVIVDFSSMYPTIMLSCHISHDNIEYEDVESPQSDVEWDDSGSVKVTTKFFKATFANNDRCISTRVIKTMMEFRKIHGASSDIYSTAIKCANNSLFGALGYSDSPLYSPRASASVSATGRWCLRHARNVLSSCGLQVLYGDTDSCMVTKSNTDGDAVVALVKRSLEVFQKSLEATPLAAMKLAVEIPKGSLHLYYKDMILLNKKSYIMISEEDTMKSRGVCIVRKDRPPVICDTFSKCIHVICANVDIRHKRRAIFIIVHKAIKRLKSNYCTISEVSCRKRKFGNMSYCYKDIDGNEAIVREDKTSHDSIVEYSAAYLINMIHRTIDPLTTKTGMGCLRILMENRQ